MDKFINAIPQVIRSSLVMPDGHLTSDGTLFLTQLVTYLQSNLSETGFRLPHLSTTQLTDLESSAPLGTMVYDSTANLPKMKRSGGWETITTTP